jgi:hypothetical protein
LRIKLGELRETIREMLEPSCVDPTDVIRWLADNAGKHKVASFEVCTPYGDRVVIARSLDLKGEAGPPRKFLVTSTTDTGGKRESDHISLKDVRDDLLARVNDGHDDIVVTAAWF